MSTNLSPYQAEKIVQMMKRSDALGTQTTADLSFAGREGLGGNERLYRRKCRRKSCQTGKLLNHEKALCNIDMHREIKPT